MNNLSERQLRSTCDVAHQQRIMLKAVHAIVARHAALAAQCGAAMDACALGAVESAYDIVVNGTASSLG